MLAHELQHTVEVLDSDPTTEADRSLTPNASTWQAVASTHSIHRGVGRISERSTGITVTVDPIGRYTIVAQDPPWSFEGDTGAPLTEINVSRGADNIGEFGEIAFSYAVSASSSQVPRTLSARRGSIRTYRGKPLLLFGSTYIDEASNTAPFPSFTTYPRISFI